MNPMHNMLTQIWDYIASDYLALCEDGVASASEVREAVGDRVGLWGDWMSDFPEQVKAYKALTLEEQRALLAEVFTGDYSY